MIIILCRALAWPEREIVQVTLAQLTWHHNLVLLLEKLKTPEQRLWYANNGICIRDGKSDGVIFSIGSQTAADEILEIQEFP